MSFGQWLILVILGAAFGASFGFNEILVGAYGPLTVSALRVGLGALGCWVWVLGTGRRVELRGAGLVGVLAFGLFQYGAPFALLPLAQQHVTSSTAGIANAMTPVAVVLISHLWSGGERITAAKLFGVGFGVCGMVLLVAQGAEGGRSEPLFILVAALAPVCYGIALNLARRFRAVDSAVLSAVAMTGAAAAIAIAALAVEGVPATPDARLAGALAVMGFGLTSAAFLVMYAILPKVGATNISLVTLVAPVSATLIGARIFGEVMGGGQIAGMALILTGLLAIDGRLWRLISRAVPRTRPAA